MYHHHQLSAQIFRFRRCPQLNEKQIFGPNNVTEAHHILLLLDNTARESHWGRISPEIAFGFLSVCHFMSFLWRIFLFSNLILFIRCVKPHRAKRLT